MNLWEKIKQGLEEGASTVSGKAVDWLISGSEAIREGAERATDKIGYGSKLAKLRWEYRSIQKAMGWELTELGGKAYDLFCQNREVDLERETVENVRKLRSLEKDLENKEREIEELPKTFETEVIDKKTVQELKKDLEAGGGAIEQVVIEDGSPFLGKKLKEMRLPEDALVGTISRKEEIIIPDGETVFQPGDKVTLLGKSEDVEKTMEQMKPAQKRSASHEEGS